MSSTRCQISCSRLRAFVTRIALAVLFFANLVVYTLPTTFAGSSQPTTTPITPSAQFQEKYLDAATNKTVNLTSGKDAPLSVAGQAHMLSFKALLERVIDALAAVIGTASLVFLVIGGFRLIAAGGNDTATTRAKDMITYSVIGLVITLLAYAIVGAWQGFLFR